MKKRIAICLEQMGSGGIETFTLNQLKALENKGNEVFVIAKKEIYSSKVEELGGRFIGFEFPLNNFFDVESKRIGYLDVDVISSKAAKLSSVAAV